MDDETLYQKAKGFNVNWNAIQAFSIIVFVSVLAYKIAVTPIDAKIDITTLLSLLLALFSVGLSALFYFKATETSNTFYDNTYKFTKDIAQLLTKIESGFGERLKHLDEGYSSMRDYMQRTPNDHSQQKAEQKLAEKEKVVDKADEERKDLINRLLERSQLQEKEKEAFRQQLEEKEKELRKAGAQVSFLKRQLRNDDRKNGSDLANDSGFRNYALERVVERIGRRKTRDSSSLEIRKAFDDIKDDLSSLFLKDMRKAGLLHESNRLTIAGIIFLRDLAKENSSRDDD